MFDMKSEMSDESLDLSKSMKSYMQHQTQPTLLRNNFEEPKDLSKHRLPTQIMHIQSMLPEQTEPEDLSMRSPRSPLTVEEMDELDDAATLYMKQRQRILQIHGTNTE